MTISSSMIGVIAESLLSCPARGCGLFQRRERSHVLRADANVPAPTLEADTYDASSITLVSLGIPQVFTPRAAAKISEPIIRPVAVNVVNILRIGARHPFVGDAVRMDVPIANGTVQIPISLDGGKRSLPGVPGIPDARTVQGCALAILPHRSWPFAPRQRTSFRFIVQQLAQRFLVGQFSWSHGAVPSRWGQGRALLAQCFRLAIYRRFTLCSQAVWAR